jgi:DNA polymerase III sliding clamp (beta) subunit (PCNA family)
MLKDLSNALGTEELILEFSSPSDAILVRPLHPEDGVRGVLMPVRINKERN